MSAVAMDRRLHCFTLLVVGSVDDVGSEDEVGGGCF